MTQETVDRPKGWHPESTFGSRLMLVRQAMGWTNARKAADAYGFDDQSYRNWENGKRCSDPIGVAQRVAEVTGVDHVWLAFGPPAGQLLVQMDLAA